jgi:hypothetical protein
MIKAYFNESFLIKNSKKYSVCSSTDGVRNIAESSSSVQCPTIDGTQPRVEENKQFSRSNEQNETHQVPLFYKISIKQNSERVKMRKNMLVGEILQCGKYVNFAMFIQFMNKHSLCIFPSHKIGIS